MASRGGYKGRTSAALGREHGGRAERLSMLALSYDLTFDFSLFPFLFGRDSRSESVLVLFRYSHSRVYADRLLSTPDA